MPQIGIEHETFVDFRTGIIQTLIEDRRLPSREAILIKVAMISLRLVGLLVERLVLEPIKYQEDKKGTKTFLASLDMEGQENWRSYYFGESRLKASEISLLFLLRCAFCICTLLIMASNLSLTYLGNQRDENGNTILLTACQNGSKKVVKLALRYGADIDAINSSRNTALHFAFK